MKLLFALSAAAVALGLVATVFMSGQKAISANAKKCEELGGIQVRTYEGFACVKELKP